MLKTRMNALAAQMASILILENAKIVLLDALYAQVLKLVQLVYQAWFLIQANVLKNASNLAQNALEMFAQFVKQDMFFKVPNVCLISPVILIVHIAPQELMKIKAVLVYFVEIIALHAPPPIVSRAMKAIIFQPMQMESQAVSNVVNHAKFVKDLIIVKYVQTDT